MSIKSAIRATEAQVAQALKSLVFDFSAAVTPDQHLELAREIMSHYGDPDVAKALVGVALYDVDAGGVPGLYLVPEGATSERRIVYLHGGGWMAGSVEGWRALGAVLAKAAACPVLLVEYRLTPENPYPAPLDDCVTALAWAWGHDHLGESRARSLFVAGDSAGGNLVASTTMRAISGDAQVPTAIALLSGMLDVRPTDFKAPGDTVCTADSVLGSTMLYTQDAISTDDPLISNVTAPIELLAKFPPTLVQIGGIEFFLENNRRFVDRLIEADVRTVFSIWPGMPHVWHHFLEVLPEAERGLTEIAAFFASEG